jgi:hypothetical protein
MKKTWMTLWIALAVLAWVTASCGGGDGSEGDADTDLADGDDTPDGIDVPPDTLLDNPPDTPPDGDVIEDVPVEPGACTDDSQCGEGEFCEYMSGLCTGTGDCVDRGSGICPTIYAPVCGCDGVTYGNDCERRYAGISLHYTGECGADACTMGDPAGLCDAETEFCEGPAGSCDESVAGWCETKPEACPDIWHPVCGCDGVTYGNDCERQAAGVWLAHEGECGETPCYQGDPGSVCDERTEFCEGPTGSCSDFVPDVWDPVCGCDGVTYGNDCDRRSAGVWLRHEGECTTTTTCYQGDPTFACDASTEFCEGPPGSCGSDVEGWCETRPSMCPDIYSPVCGCNGVTYGNDCERQAAGVWLFYRGECTSEVCYQGDPGGVCAHGEFCDGPEGACSHFDVPGRCVAVPGACPYLWDPVCGCDGNTYANDCLRQAAMVWLDYRGECSVARVCGPDGALCPAYQFCEYPPGDCGTGGADGTCMSMPDVCPLYYDPVCGCDGRTYGNDCMRQAAGVSQDYRGACT